MKRSLAVVAGLGIVAATFAYAYTSNNAPTAKAAVKSTPVQAAAGKVFLVESVTKRVGNKAVDFVWKDGGKNVSFSEFTQGKVVLLNIWATWCGPCKREIPDLVEISKEMAPKGVLVVGVSLDEVDNKLALVKGFVERANISYLNVIDNLQIAQEYGGVRSIPTTFIIDRQGNVVQKIIGMQTKEAFMAAINKAMQGQ